MINPHILRKQKIILGLLCMLILATLLIGMGIGSGSVSYSEILPTLLGHGSFDDQFVLVGVRLPRMIITFFSGMALSVSGAILQGLTKNDLADPGIIGINSGAGLTITIFYLFFPIDQGNFSYMIPVVAFFGALITTYLIFLFSNSRKTGFEPVKLVLVGVGFSLALSGLMIIIISSTDAQKVSFIAEWLAGNIWGTSWPFVWSLISWLVVLIPFTLIKANRLNLLTLNDSLSIGVGLAINRERIILLFTAVALAATAVSVTGGIAFVGLMAPHLAKSLIGPRFQLFMPIAILIGGWLLLFADLIGHNIVMPDGIPAGVMTALIGAPYFIYLLLRKI
ncbi:iron ABC transporter permease [Pullulanibacillus sp. KACC 23026]|uniref:FecCD family ABC transporter permease n=1 Tax=Pullulanibacillus sp. KACC 23026 TaxID=3028315 RepID=UPI0023B186D2|nr:iron ABC transporter permease [Pullulanibacillus sp. KACC 23026]WEG14438.1 iron ABC transporter permease [Pullulanibacillus sp. KACC 23026]